jgi:hypothetical protein
MQIMLNSEAPERTSTAGAFPDGEEGPEARLPGQAGRPWHLRPPCACTPNKRTSSCALPNKTASLITQANSKLPHGHAPCPCAHRNRANSLWACPAPTVAAHSYSHPHASTQRCTSTTKLRIIPDLKSCRPATSSSCSSKHGPQPRK